MNDDFNYSSDEENNDDSNFSQEDIDLSEKQEPSSGENNNSDSPSGKSPTEDNKNEDKPSGDEKLSRPKRLSKEFLQREYVELGKSKEQIAQEQGLTLGQVNYDIFILGVNKGMRQGFSKKPLSKEVLTDMYLRQKLTVVEMARQLSNSEDGKVSTSRIIKTLTKWGIKKYRDGVWQPPMPKEELRSLYEDEELTLEDLMIRFGVSLKVIKKSLKYYEITVRKGPKPTSAAIGAKKRVLGQKINRLQKERGELDNRERTIRRPPPCSEETKGKIREKAIMRKPPEHQISEPQKKARKILTKLGVDFMEEYPIAGIGRFDFFLKDFSTILEVDGRYWHSLPDNMEKDRAKEAGAAKAGYKVFRIWEDHVCEEKIEEVLNCMR